MGNGRRGRGRGRRRGGQGYGRGWRRGQRDRGAPFPDEEGLPPMRKEVILKPVILSFDELEALRLVDLEGLYQEEAARMIGISRRTLWSDLKRARRKVVTALVEGRPIRIIGGSQVFQELPSQDQVEPSIRSREEE